MFTDALFDELEKIALTLSATAARGMARIKAGHGIMGQNPTRANLVNAGQQHADKRNIPSIDSRAGVPSHQLSKNQVGQAFHAKKSFESPNTFKSFTPATTSGAKPLGGAQKDALRSRLIGSFRNRHGVGSHVPDSNVANRMKTSNELAKRRTARFMGK